MVWNFHKLLRSSRDPEQDKQRFCDTYKRILFFSRRKKIKRCENTLWTKPCWSLFSHFSLYSLRAFVLSAETGFDWAQLMKCTRYFFPDVIHIFIHLKPKTLMFLSHNTHYLLLQNYNVKNRHPVLEDNYDHVFLLGLLSDHGGRGSQVTVIHEERNVIFVPHDKPLSQTVLRHFITSL